MQRGTSSRSRLSKLSGEIEAEVSSFSDFADGGSRALTSDVNTSLDCIGHVDRF